MVTFKAFRQAVFFSNKISEDGRLGVNVASKISRPTLNRLDKKKLKFGRCMQISAAVENLQRSFNLQSTPFKQAKLHFSTRLIHAHIEFSLIRSDLEIIKKFHKFPQL